MTAGLNCLVNIIRLATTDDDVGGAYSTGTVLHQNVQARIDEEPTRTDFLQQGLETVKIFSGMFRGYRLLFREQDQVEVVSPPNHEYYGQRFRVVDKTGSSNHPAQKRNVWIVKLTRSQRSHGNPYQ
jgi:hypothetical protein